MKKVMRIIGRLNVGGPAIHTVLLTHLLDPCQYETTLVTGTEGETEGSMRYLAAERGVVPVVISEMGREISWREDLVALRKLIRLMRAIKPDIIHTHTAKAGTLGRIAAVIALPGRRKRLYHTFHGHVFHSYFSERKTRAFIRVEQFLARRTDRLIAVSARTKQELVDFGIAPEEKIEVMPLGLDLDSFANCASQRGELRKELDLPADALLIGLVARLVPVKGIAYFLNAAACVAQRVPNAWFLLIGDGELRESLEMQARTLGLADRVRFLGYRKDLTRIYADLDIVTLSSLNEGLPVSLIEAMASGCIAVSTAVGGVPNLIEDGATGFLAPPKDADALAHTLLRALEARPQWPSMTQHAQEFALSHFHIQRLVADMERLYSH